MNIIGCIPSRLESSRLPGKALRCIQGKPLILHVAERAIQSSLVNQWYVLTDHALIADTVNQSELSAHLSVVMTDPHCLNGTERIIDYCRGAAITDSNTLFVNVQGDEWSLQPDHIDYLVEKFMQSPEADIGTLAYPTTQVTDMQNPSIVKVVMNNKQHALYFSRQCIPSKKDGSLPPVVFAHMGIYIYRYSALMDLAQSPPSSLEVMECLEQLRALQQGLSVAIFLVNSAHKQRAIDTEDDWHQARMSTSCFDLLGKT